MCLRPETEYIVDDVGMEHTKNTCIYERVARERLSALWIEVQSRQHDVGLSSGVHGVLAAPEVVRSVIHAQNFVAENAISLEQDLLFITPREL